MSGKRRKDKDEYAEFVARKLSRQPPTGITEVPELHPGLFDFQRDLVSWALKKGRAALFADTGMGKTRMQLEWARHVPGDVLILAPLAVASQTVEEGKAIGLDVTLCRDVADVKPGINITNYDRLHRFDPSRFKGVVLDESSIIKHHDAKTLGAMLDAFARTPFKLCATATPSPNDFTELGTHAEFLGVCTRTEMLAEYFCHDGGETQVWRLKGHARAEFWRWVASWAAMVRNPADLGYDGSAYVLPQLTVEQHTIAADHSTAKASGMLFAEPAKTMSEQRDARRGTIESRVKAAADLVNASSEHWIVWCDLNDESRALVKAIDGAVEVTGAMSVEEKERALAWFAGELECTCGKERSLITTGQSDTQTTQSSEPGSSPSQKSDSRPLHWSSVGSTTENTSGSTASDRTSSPSGKQPGHAISNEGDSSTQPTLRCERSTELPRRTGRGRTRTSGLSSECAYMGSPEPTTTGCSLSKTDDAPYASTMTRVTQDQVDDFTSTIATSRALSEDFYAHHATSQSGSSATVPTCSIAQPCTCGRQATARRVLVSKSSITGWGLNWQHCARMAFVGVTHSWESYYQAVRRCWRFGQTRPVDVHVFASELEGNVIANLQRKERDAIEMAEQLSAETREAVRAEVRGQRRHTNAYAPKQTIVIPDWMKETA